MRNRGIKNTGWQRTNHRVHIDKYDDDLFASLECPPCCPSVANEHLQMLDPRDFWRGSPLGGVQVNEDDSLWDQRYWQCIGQYEQESIGLIDGYRDNRYGDTLDDESAKVLDALPDGSYEVEIEFCAIYGWSDSGPWGPAEYEWEFGWRFVGEPLALS